MARPHRYSLRPTRRVLQLMLVVRGPASFYSPPPRKYFLTPVSLVETASLQVEGIAANVESGCTVLRAGHFHGERTTAMSVANPSNPSRIRYRHVCVLILCMFSCIRDSHIQP